MQKFIYYSIATALAGYDERDWIVFIRPEQIDDFIVLLRWFGRDQDGAELWVRTHSRVIYRPDKLHLPEIRAKYQHAQVGQLLGMRWNIVHSFLDIEDKPIWYE